MQIKTSIRYHLTLVRIAIIKWRRQWHPIPVLLPGKSHGQRSLVGCSPWSRLESDKTERLHFHFSLSCIGEGNGNPLQCSCLENPRDKGAWWAAVSGVAQSRTRLKRLSRYIYIYIYINKQAFARMWKKWSTCTLLVKIINFLLQSSKVNANSPTL